MKCSHLALAAALFVLGSTAHADGNGYRIAGKFALGGEGGWDYPAVDTATHRLYLSRADHVQVVDTVTGKEVAVIPDTQGVHGIALAPALGHGYISCGKANAVKVFDLKTNVVLATIPTGENPDSILFEPKTQRVFTFNGHSKNSSVIDTKTNQVVATIPLDGKPEFSRADGNGEVFVNIEDKAELTTIDAAKATVKATFKLPQCESPSGLALDAKHRRSFSTCDKSLAVLNVDSGKPVANIPIGDGTDGAEFDPSTQTVFTANGEGNLSIIRETDPDHYTALPALETQRGARTIALDPATHRLYLPTAQFGPAPTDKPHARPPVLKDTFVVVVVAPGS
jgi:YVTN family beta-propeller protein